MDGAAALEMNGITKAFNGVPVLKGVGFRLERGEVLGLLGENGAGKSTLVKVLCGVHDADAGKILIDGRVVHVRDTSHANELGIRTVYQELSLFPHLRVYENMFIHEELSFGAGSIAPLDRRRMMSEARRVLRDTLGLDIDVSRRLADLTLAEQQLVEIGRAVYQNARILILDEPTTTLESAEKRRLFQVIHDLTDHGTSVVFISHHLEEVKEICDQVVILRDGLVVADERTENLDVRSIISAMSGKAPDEQYPKTRVPIGDIVLKVEGLRLARAYEDVSFEVRAGEIVGIVGLVGCGKSELIRTVYGALRPDAGRIEVAGAEVAMRSPRVALAHGLSYLASDRKTEGIFSSRSVGWNLTIGALRKVKRWFGLDPRAERQLVTEKVAEFGVRLATPAQQITGLSGGNQQKVLFARSLMVDPRVLLVEEPTRGIDVNAKTDIYRLISHYVADGNAVVMVSSEESEVLGMSDRVLVMREGRVRADLPAAEATLDRIKLYAMSNED